MVDTIGNPLFLHAVPSGMHCLGEGQVCAPGGCVNIPREGHLAI
jgi:hypothetical protein